MILKKHEWQKPHQSNMTGTDKAYYPNKNKDVIKKNIKLGKIKRKNFFLNIILFIFFFTQITLAK